MNHVLHLNRVLAESIECDGAGCWIYKGQQSRDGYGKVWIDGRRVFTHRFIYELLRGPLPDGLQIDHLCRVKLCCNPLHLEPVTLQENRRREGRDRRSRQERQAQEPPGEALTVAVHVAGQGRARRHRREVRR
jgi:hypothetical protein